MVIEVVDFPIENGGSFHSRLLVYQAGSSPTDKTPLGAIGPSSNCLRRVQGPRGSAHLGFPVMAVNRVGGDWNLTG